MNRAILPVISLLILICLPLPVGAQSGGVPHGPTGVPTQIVLEKENPVISPALSDLLSGLDPDTAVRVWVFFTDKGIFTGEDYRQAQTGFENTITELALKRRLKNGVQTDLIDLPLNQDYVDQVLNLGGKLKHRSRWLNAVSVEIQANRVEEAARLAFVRQIGKVAAFRRRLPEPVPFLAKPYPHLSPAAYGRNYGPSMEQLDQIYVPVVHDMGFKGEGVIVGMLDTGYRKDHQAFATAYAQSRVIAEWDFINDDANTQNEGEDPSNQHDHGTSVWSALGGEYPEELYGPAFRASFVLAKTENVSHELPVEEDDWVAGLEWADSIGAEVTSSSLGYIDWYTYQDLDGNTALCTRAVDLAASRGILVVTAAGNERDDPWYYIIAPADADSVIAVGAVDSEGMITGFSSAGPTYDGRIKPEMVARGYNTYCAVASGTDQYGGVGGTSLSTPLVGGCAAVLLSAHPDWTNMQAREALMMTADRATIPDNLYGWGLVNLFDALNYNPSGALTIGHHPPLFSSDTLNPYVIDAAITPGHGLDEDSLFLFWRSDTLSTFVRENLQSMGSDQYRGEIPAQAEGSVVQYYISAHDTLSYVVNLPLGAPDFTFKLFIATESIWFDLEDGLFLWQTGGTGNHWSMTSVDSHQGKFSLTDSPPGEYDNQADSWAQIEQTFDLSDVPSPQLSFWHKYQFWSGDSGLVEINTDGGKGWERLSVFADSQGEWTQVSLLLSPYAGQSSVKFRFRLTSDAAGTGDGWYIDDVQVNFRPTCVEEEPSSIPQEFCLGQNYPNPFNPSTTIPFTVQGHVHTTLRIYNVRGQLVRILMDEETKPGRYSVVWDGTDQRGKELSSGIYFYKLSTEHKTVTKKTLLLK